MKIQTGCDIVQISKFSKALQSKKIVLENLFNPSESANNSAEHLAGIFAAKEAAVKALNQKAGNWTNYEIAQNGEEKPQLNILEATLAKKISQISVSISHDGDYALAIVVAMLK